MFKATKQLFIVLLSFNEFLTCDWCLILNDEPSLVRSTLIDLNPVNLHIIHSWLVCINVLEVVMYFQICVPKETKDINVKAFNMIKKKKTKHNNDKSNEKTIIQVIVNSNSIVQHAIHQINKIRQCNYKNYCNRKKDYRWTPSICICEDSECLKSIPHTSVIECDEVISVMKNDK